MEEKRDLLQRIVGENGGDVNEIAFEEKGGGRFEHRNLSMEMILLLKKSKMK